MFGRFLFSLFMVGNLLLQSATSQAVTFVHPETQQKIEVREMNDQDVGLLQTQLHSLQEMDEDALRIQLEIQASQIESALNKADTTGVVVSEETREQALALVDSIRDVSRKPLIKKKMIRRILMFLPRVVTQGVGYMSTAMTDLIAIPLVFTTMSSFFTFSGEDPSGVGLGFGIGAGILSGASVTIGELLVLGYAFPVYVGSIVPIQLTISLICEKQSIESPYTRKFCKNIEKNENFLHKVGDAGKNTGIAINRFFRHPLKVLGLRK